MSALVFGLDITAEEQEELTQLADKKGKSIAELARDLLVAELLRSKCQEYSRTQIDMSYFK